MGAIRYAGSMDMQVSYLSALTLATVGCGISAAADVATMKSDKPSVTATEQPATHRGTGVVKAVDANAGTITLSHEAVATIKWPAMTMPFKASRELMAGVKPGDRVDFEFVAKGMDATITAISKHRQ